MDNSTISYRKGLGSVGTGFEVHSTVHDDD